MKYKYYCSLSNCYQHSSPPQSYENTVVTQNCANVTKLKTVAQSYGCIQTRLSLSLLPSTTRYHEKKEQLSKWTQSEMKAVTTHLPQKLNVFILSAELGNLTPTLSSNQVTGFPGAGRGDWHTSTCNVSDHLQPTVRACTSNKNSQSNCSHLTQLLQRQHATAVLLSSSRQPILRKDISSTDVYVSVKI